MYVYIYICIYYIYDYICISIIFGQPPLFSLLKMGPESRTSSSLGKSQDFPTSRISKKVNTHASTQSTWQKPTEISQQSITILKINRISQNFPAMIPEHPSEITISPPNQPCLRKLRGASPAQQRRHALRDFKGTPRALRHHGLAKV